MRNDVSLRVGGPVCNYVLRDLRGETDYCNIKVHARTKADLDGESATIEKVTTLPPSMRELLVKEIQRVQEVEGDFVDTEFYTGFVQREYKPDYLARLKADLAEAYEAEKAALDISEEDQEKAKSRWKTSAWARWARAPRGGSARPEERTRRRYGTRGAGLRS